MSRQDRPEKSERKYDRDRSDRSDRSEQRYERTDKNDKNDKTDLRAMISSEVTSQLLNMKQKIDLEIVEDMAKLKKELMAEISAAMKMSQDTKRQVSSQLQEVRAATQRVDDISKEVESQLTSVNNQIVLSGERQLAVTKEATKALVLAVGEKVAEDVYVRVVGEINDTIVPKVNNMVQWVNYQTQDTTDMLTDYRRAVEHTANSGHKLITDGKDKSVITPHVRTFFNEYD